MLYILWLYDDSALAKKSCVRDGCYLLKEGPPSQHPLPTTMVCPAPVLVYWWLPVGSASQLHIIECAVRYWGNRAWDGDIHGLHGLAFLQLGFSTWERLRQTVSDMCFWNFPNLHHDKCRCLHLILHSGTQQAAGTCSLVSGAQNFILSFWFPPQNKMSLACHVFFCSGECNNKNRKTEKGKFSYSSDCLCCKLGSVQAEHKGNCGYVLKADSLHNTGTVSSIARNNT